MRNLALKAMSGILAGAMVGGLLAASPAAAAPAAEPLEAAVAAAPLAAVTGDPLGVGMLLVAGTSECLAADYSNVYTIDCDLAPAAGQYWQVIDGGNSGYFKLKAAIGTCLSNLNWTAVWTTGCSSGDDGVWWTFHSSGRLMNWNTGEYLVADYTHRVYLNPTAGMEQGWSIRY